ncbi:hypothetical protein GHT06_015410 [Daphnia sinensis]|uniref:DNA repair protein complementing XP-C cells homolog n=1 Tax=Daphnia sinensis TaxID=1820382 RepID=A0AAD5KTB3_9CRUS|nr:hypothetical protein GHT06_015410 [Daphnia sinensis]
MAPSKGAKRKSNSPHTEGVERKRYSTRSSSKKRVSYTESVGGDSGEENEAPSKTANSSDDDDFVIEDREAKHEEKKKQSPPSTTASQTKKKNVKHLALGQSDVPKQANSRVLPNVPINIGFKPVSIDITKMKSELDLSDSSDSESSLNNDCCSKTPASKSISKIDHESESSPYKKQEQEEVLCSAIRNELVEESDKINPWLQNLEALKSDAGELQETKPKQIEKKQPTRGKKIKPPNKKSPKFSKKKDQTDESSVAEMLELEKAQDSSSSDSDDENWEKVKAPCVASERERELPKSVEITLELSGLKQKKKGLDVENMIRLKINRIRREIQLDLHQTSLVGLLAHGYLINKMLSDPEIMAAALSIVPSTGFPPTRTDLNYLEKFVKWTSNHFKINTAKIINRSPGKQDILNCVSSGKAQSISELVCTCLSICRSLGILSRLVLSLQPLPAKVDSSELQPKSQSTKKKVEKPSPDQSQKVAAERSGTHSSGSQNTKKTEVGAEPTPTGTKSNSRKNPARATTDRCKPNLPVKSRVANLRETNMPKPSTSKVKDPKSPVKSTEQTKEEPKRTRRKSAEKPVKYEESPLDDTEEDVSRRKTIKKQIPTKEKLTRNKKNIEPKKPKEKITPKRRRKSSSDEFEEPMSDDSENPVPKKAAIKKECHARSKKIISTDSEGETLAKRKKNIDIWMEVYLEQEEQWMSVDVTSGQIHCDRHLERHASDPMLYVVAYNSDLTWKDVTARYASSFLSTTRKQRAHPTWKKILSIHREKPSPRSKAEDENLEKSLVDRPMPTSISEFKSHPLYALQRHLLKFEAIYPPTAIPVGYIRKEAVYARECVKNLHSRETWLKEAKVVRIGEKPYKIVKARPKWDRYSQKMVTDQPLELFGDWQIEDYVPPPAVDGVVPRNAYGNVELFLPTMLPKGTTHLQIPGLNKVARRLGIDCAPAMTGWDYHGGWSHPVYDGYVVCDEHVETLMDAWRVANEEQEKREREKKEKRVYDNWRRLIRGLLIRDRLQTKYFKNVIEEDIPPVVDATANEVVQVALSNRKSTKTPLSNKRQKKK